MYYDPFEVAGWSMERWLDDNVPWPPRLPDARCRAVSMAALLTGYR
jgi:hypothetical protein